MPTLPRFVRPMLARPGGPFDSPEHLFEVKWDGMRALAFVQREGYRLLSRGGNPLSEQFPELGCLAELPPGTVLDGDLVVLREGKPEFSLLAARHHLRDPHRIGTLARTTPAVLMAFDLLYCGYEPLMGQPLEQRRERLAETLRRAGQQHLVFSTGIVGAGRAFYEQVVARGLEGVVAKHLASRYLPGRRSEAWVKIKPRGGGRQHGPAGPSAAVRA